MKVIEHIQKAKGETLFSFEILPPIKGERARNIVENVAPLIEYNPAFIDVTYHREEYYYQELAGGLAKKIITKKRPATIGLCAALQTAYKIDTIPHILCGGFSKEDTENFLIDLDFLEINNVVALRGDPIKSQINFIAETNGNRYASELVTQINDLKSGNYLNETLAATNLDFCIGVAGYPEKHLEAPNLVTDLRYLKHKVECGADYIITQMFFDNEVYFNFVAQCRAIGITVPIIPGLKPLTTRKQLTMLPHRFKIDLPHEFTNEIINAKDDQAIKQIGIEHCINQSKELKAAGVPVIHYYSMSNITNILKIVDQIW